jgi:hypothetical protein
MEASYPTVPLQFGQKLELQSLALNFSINNPKLKGEPTKQSPIIVVINSPLNL